MVIETNKKEEDLGDREKILKKEYVVEEDLPCLLFTKFICVNANNDSYLFISLIHLRPSFIIWKFSYVDNYPLFSEWVLMIDVSAI